MTALFGALVAAVAAVTVLHLGSRPRGRATAFPSFQHLEGLAPRRRPALPLEEPLAWALRVLALALAAAALFLARRPDRRTTAVLVEPGSRAWASAEAFARSAAGPALALTFDAARPRVAASPKAAEAAERARRSLDSCSAPFEACLDRAARAIGANALGVSSFRARRASLADFGSCRYLRVDAPDEAAAAPPAPAKAGATRVVRSGRSPAARLWAAALEAASEDMGAGETAIAVADAADPAAPGWTLVPVASASAPFAARTSPITHSVSLSEDAALAAGRPALELETALALEPDPSQAMLVAPVLAAGGRTILAAGGEEELGAWAHSGALLSLARVALFASGRRIETTAASAGRHGWLSAESRKPAPVGLEDVPPGQYVRDDGRVSLALPRAAALPLVAPQTDAELARQGGRRLDALPAPAAPSRLPLGLLVLALLARLADRPRARGPALLAYAAVGAALLVLAADPAPTSRAVVRNAVLTTGRLALPGAVRDDGCALPGGPRPCTITARAALATESAGANALVFAPDRPRVALGAIELPAELRAGEAGLLRATLVVARAAGRPVVLTVHPTSGPEVQTRAEAASDSEALTLSVPVRTATEGIAFALVHARVGAGEDGDAAVVPLVTRARPARRLVLAAAPGWEARAAAEALARRGAVERITRLGRTAVLARGAPAEDPLDRLGRDLSAYDLVVVCGFSREDLAGAGEQALRRYAAAGGAVLFLGGIPDLPSLPLPLPEAGADAAASALPSRVTGAFGQRTLPFLGFPAPKTALPIGGAVLARLDGKPWVIGRAVGGGRIAAITAPDAWRAGSSGAAPLLDAVLAWLEAGRVGAGLALSPDLAALVAGDRSVPLPASTFDGLPVDPADPLALLPEGPARARVEALRRRVPFLTADSPGELTALLGRVPQPEPLPRRIAARERDAIWWALCALLAAEVALRRRAARRHAPSLAERQAA